MTGPGTMTNNSIRQHSEPLRTTPLSRIPVGLVGRVHHQVGGSRGGERGTGPVGVDSSGGAGDPIPAPNARNSG